MATDDTPRGPRRSGERGRPGALKKATGSRAVRRNQPSTSDGTDRPRRVRSAEDQTRGAKSARRPRTQRAVAEGGSARQGRQSRAKRGDDGRTKASSNRLAPAGPQRRRSSTSVEPSRAERTQKRATPGTRNGKQSSSSQPRRRPATSPKPAPKLTAAQKRERAEAQRRRKHHLRIISVVLAAIAVLALVILGFKYSMSKIEQHTTPVNPVDELQPVACEFSMLTSTVTQQGDAAGYPVNFTLSILNDRGVKPCFLDTGNDKTKMVITSGDELIYDSQACEAGPENRRLLLDTDLSASQSFYWNGKASGPNCSGTLDAQPGTYIARFYHGDAELLDRGHVFDLQPLSESKETETPTEPADEATTAEPESRGVATDEPTQTAEPTDIGSPTADPNAHSEASNEPADPFDEGEDVAEGSDLTEP